MHVGEIKIRTIDHQRMKEVILGTNNDILQVLSATTFQKAVEKEPSIMHGVSI